MTFIYFCTWSRLDRDGQPMTFFDKQTGKSKLRRFSEVYHDYTRNGALRQFREAHKHELDEIVKVNCEKVRV